MLFYACACVGVVPQPNNLRNSLGPRCAPGGVKSGRAEGRGFQNFLVNSSSALPLKGPEHFRLAEWGPKGCFVLDLILSRR